LEKKDDEELEDMRQKRLEVEAQVQKLQARLHEFEASPPKDINVLEGRVRKLTSALEKICGIVFVADCRIDSRTHTIVQGKAGESEQRNSVLEEN